jgi:hypothetical protein
MSCTTSRKNRLASMQVIHALPAWTPVIVCVGAVIVSFVKRMVQDVVGNAHLRLCLDSGKSRGWETLGKSVTALCWKGNSVCDGNPQHNGIASGSPTVVRARSEWAGHR